jgi:hypothetical protein
MATLAATTIVVVACFVGYYEYDNSRDVPMPSDAELRARFSRASAWIIAQAVRDPPQVSTLE